MKKEEKTIKDLIKEQLKRKGLKMSKQLTGGGLFSSSTYDIRNVYSLEDVDELTKKGFFVDESLGTFIWNAVTNN